MSHSARHVIIRPSNLKISESNFAQDQDADDGPEDDDEDEFVPDEI